MELRNRSSGTTTTLHRIVRENLETYLALANEVDPTVALREGGEG
jgi:hypothetical protein